MLEFHFIQYIQGILNNGMSREILLDFKGRITEFSRLGFSKTLVLV